MTFRKNIGDFNEVDLNKDADIIKTIDSTNKNKNINLIVINLSEKNKISQKLEEYLIKLNKKVLIISKTQVNFNNFSNDLVEQKEIIKFSDLKQVFNDLKKLFEQQGYQINWKDLENQSVEQTINTLSMASPFTLEEKQILLETKN